MGVLPRHTLRETGALTGQGKGILKRVPPHYSKWEVPERWTDSRLPKVPPSCRWAERIRMVANTANRYLVNKWLHFIFQVAQMWLPYLHMKRLRLKNFKWLPWQMVASLRSRWYKPWSLSSQASWDLALLVKDNLKKKERKKERLENLVSVWQRKV